MSVTSDREQALLAKIRDLPDARMAQVEDFVDFLRSRDAHRGVVQASGDGATRLDDAGARLDRMYEQYIKPVEQEHLGEYALVTPAGEAFFASSESELIAKTEHVPDGDNCLFKVGELAATKVL